MRPVDSVMVQQAQEKELLLLGRLQAISGEAHALRPLLPLVPRRLRYRSLGRDQRLRRLAPRPRPLSSARAVSKLESSCKGSRTSAWRSGES